MRILTQNGRCLIVMAFISCALCCMNAHAFADEKHLLFNIGPEGFPPFMINEKNNPAGGIMVEVLQTIAGRLGYTVIFNAIPRKRVEMMMLSGDLDVTPRAREWTDHPESFEFSDPIVQIREAIFVLKDSGMNHLEDLYGKRMGVRLGYVHKQLEPYFANKTIIRSDAPNEWAMFKKLMIGRTEALSCCELVGLWMIKKNQWQGTFDVFEKEISSAGYCLMFSKKWRPFVQSFNRELAAMQKRGELDIILSRYRLGQP